MGFSEPDARTAARLYPNNTQQAVEACLMGTLDPIEIAQTIAQKEKWGKDNFGQIFGVIIWTCLIFILFYLFYTPFSYCLSLSSEWTAVPLQNRNAKNATASKVLLFENTATAKYASCTASYS
jgi:hypothetical protein